MDTFDAIKKRRSIRSFAPREVEFEKLVNILDAANAAPSAGNLQDWKFIIIYRAETKDALAACCPKQEWIAHAPVLIVVTADFEKDEEHYGERGKNLYSIQNSAAATQNLLIAATAEGLGTCWVGSFNENGVHDVLGIPDNARALAIVALGHYDDPPVPLPRKRTEDVVFFHTWGNTDTSLAKARGAYHDYITAALTKLKEWLNQ